MGMLRWGTEEADPGVAERGEHGNGLDPGRGMWSPWVSGHSWGLYDMGGNRANRRSQAFSVPQPLSTWQDHKLDSAGTSRCHMGSLQCGEGLGTHLCEGAVGTIGDGRSADIERAVLGPGMWKERLAGCI